MTGSFLGLTPTLTLTLTLTLTQLPHLAPPLSLPTALTLALPLPLPSVHTPGWHTGQPFTVRAKTYTDGMPSVWSNGICSRPGDAGCPRA